MTANEARNFVPGINEKLQQYINRIDEDIKATAKRGGRHIKNSYGSVSYNSDLAQHYREQGFEVHHYVAPFDELEIQW